MQTKPINIKLLRLDGDTQSRYELDENVVEEYANAVADGAVFPPPLVFFDGENYWVSWGFHRIAANKLTGRASIVCEVRTGSQFDAKVNSAGANAQHGLPRKNIDKRCAVEMLLRDPTSAEWSDARLAETCVVTRQFVSDIRKPEKRAARDQRAADKKGEPATAPDPKPGTQPGVVKVLPRVNLPATVAPPPVETLMQDAPTAQELHDENPVHVLREEVERLNDRLAVEAMDASEEEKSLAAETITTLRRELLAMTAERDSYSGQFSIYLRENNELKGMVKSLQRRLDQATGKTPPPAPKKK